MKKLTITILILITLVVGSSLVASCTQGEVTKTATATNTMTTTLTITTTDPGATKTVTATVKQPPPGTTTQPPSTLQPTIIAGELAASGETLYNNICTYPVCHAKWGEGGKDEFTAEKLNPFSNAGRVFNLIRNIMHLNILDYQEEVPSQDDYLQILGFMLVQSDIIQSNDLVVLEDLANIPIDIEPDE